MAIDVFYHLHTDLFTIFTCLLVSTEGEGSVDLLIKIGCFVKEKKLVSV